MPVLRESRRNVLKRTFARGRKPLNSYIELALDLHKKESFIDE